MGEVETTKHNKKEKYSWSDYNYDVRVILKFIKNKGLIINAIYGIPKGGLILGVHLANILNIPLITTEKEFRRLVKYEKILVVDDVSDSGITFSKIPDIDKCYTASLCIKKGTKFIPDIWCNKYEQDVWIVYEWEEAEE